MTSLVNSNHIYANMCKWIGSFAYKTTKMKINLNITSLWERTSSVGFSLTFSISNLKVLTKLNGISPLSIARISTEILLFFSQSKAVLSPKTFPFVIWNISHIVKMWYLCVSSTSSSIQVNAPITKVGSFSGMALILPSSKISCKQKNCFVKFKVVRKIGSEMFSMELWLWIGVSELVMPMVYRM